MNQVYHDIELYIPQLNTYALSITRNGTAAEDLVQDCLTRALAKADMFKPGTNLRAWLFTIMHNLHASHMRKRPGPGQLVESDAAPIAISELPRQDQRLAVRTVAEAFEELPPLQRRTLKMATIEGRPYEEIAKELHVSVGTVKSRVARGRETLRESLEGVIHRDAHRAHIANGAGAGVPSLAMPRPNGPAAARHKKH